MFYATKAVIGNEIGAWGTPTDNDTGILVLDGVNRIIILNSAEQWTVNYMDTVANPFGFYLICDFVGAACEVVGGTVKVKDGINTYCNLNPTGNGACLFYFMMLSGIPTLLLIQKNVPFNF